MRRLILAASCGTLIAAMLMSFDVFFVDQRPLAILDAVHGISTTPAAIAFMTGFLFVFGALPAIAIGWVLRRVGRAAPSTLVLAPAGLFLLTLAEVAYAMRDASLALECLPAMAAGGLVMFWILARETMPEPVFK
jgi:hypothetical protein